MKLFCVKFKDSDDKIIDVIHILAKNDKEVHSRMDDFLEKCEKYHLGEYHSYSFFEINWVDGKIIEIKAR